MEVDLDGGEGAPYFGYENSKPQALAEILY